MEYNYVVIYNRIVIIVRVIFIRSFLFYCLVLNHSFSTNLNKITNCLKLILFLITTFTKLQFAPAFVYFDYMNQVPLIYSTTTEITSGTSARKPTSKRHLPKKVAVAKS